MTRTRTLRFLSHVALSVGSASLALSGCAPAELEAVTTEEELLATAATVKGSSLRSLGFVAASLDSDSLQPVYLTGRVPAAIRSREEARDFAVSILSRSLRLAPESDFVFHKESRDAAGYRYLRLRQTHGGVPVEQGELTLQVAEDGAVHSVIGRPVPELRISTRPALAAESAVQGALGRLVKAGKSVVHEAPRLVIHTGLSGKPQLTYHAVVEYQGQEGLAFEDLYIDASSGEVVTRLSRVHTGLNRSIYDGKKACLATGSELPGTLVYNEGGTSTDTVANAAYTNTGLTYWFYKHFLGRDSYDGSGALLKSSVHFTFSTGFSCSGANAAWLGSPYNQMVYGDGDGTTFTPLALAVDVTAHELTHAVTDLTSDLVYSNESGALNEAMSDIFGAAAEAWKGSGGSATGNPASITPTANTWKIGEEITVPGGLPGNALRFMNNPTADAYSKDYYPERLTGSSDNGGVHGNSGIANLAFYLLSQGGTHPRSKTTTSVTGIGIAKATKIFFAANTTILTSSAKFQDARNATAQAAKDLYGACSAEWVNTHKAWDAVGVLGTWTPCGTGDTVAPTVSLTAPTAGSTLTGSVTVSANATDNVGVASVDFYAGTTLIGTDTTSPYSLSWNTTGVANGAYTLTAKAKDGAGNVGTSTGVAVTVSNSGGGTTQNEAEPNGSFNQGNVVSTSGTTVNAYISSTTDKDYFKVTLGAGKTLQAAMTPPSGSDFDLYIYDQSKVLVAKSENDVGLVDSASATNKAASAGTFYIHIKYYAGASTTNPYKLKLTF
ncbi:MAG: M4 family metallopeptidase [Deltaproteobacteria bacterium]|jgi:Zn-dependent metalloprotease|nr:M4 family metallopeptidase [Deltaproteobacteria bacterium]